MKSKHFPPAPGEVSPSGPLHTGAQADAGAHLAHEHTLQEGLSAALAGQVIPRLVKAHRSADEPVTDDTAAQSPAPAARASVGDADGPSPLVAELCRLVRLREEHAAEAWIDGLLRDQYPPEALLLDLLAPAARYLGELWNTDECDFTEVTVGVWRLEKLLHRIAGHPDIVRRPLRSPRRVLLIPAPGEQHVFGLSMVSQFFRQAGWDVRGMTSDRRTSLLDTVRNDWFDVVGISASCEKNLDTIQSCVQDIRRVSRNRSIRIIVGGRLFVEHPECRRAVGADAFAEDGRQAVELAESFVLVVARYA